LILTNTARKMEKKQPEKMCCHNVEEDKRHGSGLDFHG
jgi:hypothetical protein